MTDEEWIKTIPSLSATALLEDLDYCGYDSYYRTIREPVVAEIKKRLERLETLEKCFRVLSNDLNEAKGYLQKLLSNDPVSESEYKDLLSDADYFLEYLSKEE